MKQHRLLVVIALILTFSLSYANEIEKVSITFEYHSDNPNETSEQAVIKAIQRAKEKLLKDKYGEDINTINTIYKSNESSGEEAKSSTKLFALSETALRGEWIETTKEKVVEGPTFTNGFWYVKVHLEGKTRSKSGTPIEIKSAFVNNEHDRDQRDIFYDTDYIYLRFSSPVDGFLCVYLVDEQQNAFCMLPYENNTVGYQAIQANKKYLFFSQTEDTDATEYMMRTDRSQETNVLYTVFSPNKFVKAVDDQGGLYNDHESLPRMLPYSDLLKWLARLQTKDEQMVVKTDMIIIKP